MRLAGKIYKDGRFWLVEVPLLDLMTQGRTKKEAYEMAADLVETMVNCEGFRAEVHRGRGEDFEIGANEPRYLMSLLLRRQREKHGLSLAEAARRLGAKSRNAYARYEQGRAVPTIEKLSELVRALGPGNELVLRQSVEA